MLQSNRDTATATIAINESLSGAVDLGGYRLGAFIMPAGWDAADMTFQGSADGTNYGNLYNASGTEETYTVAVDLLIYVPASDRFNFRFVKFRSGPNAAPVTQTAARSITCILVP